MTETAQNVPLPNSNPDLNGEGVEDTSGADRVEEVEEGEQVGEETRDAQQENVAIVEDRGEASEDEVEGLVRETPREQDIQLPDPTPATMVQDPVDGVEETETAQSDAADPQLGVPASGLEDNDHQAAVVLTDEAASEVPTTTIRAPTPSSRTSTPPLTASGVAPVKSFRAVNVNKQFLKTASPSGTAPSITKLSGECSAPFQSRMKLTFSRPHGYLSRPDRLDISLTLYQTYPFTILEIIHIPWPCNTWVGSTELTMGQTRTAFSRYQLITCQSSTSRAHQSATHFHLERRDGLGTGHRRVRTQKSMEDGHCR